MKHPRLERRAADRPSNGDRTACPRCGATTLEFNERYRVALRSGISVTLPAWICDVPLCKLIRFARSQDGPLIAAPGFRRARRKRSE